MHTYFFEALMLVCFGVSWPVSIAKSLRTRFVGYVSGVLHKCLNPEPSTGHVSLVVWLYVMNLAMVAVDLLLYIRYRNNTERTTTPVAASDRAA